MNRRPTVLAVGEPLGVLRSESIGSLEHASGLIVGTGGAEHNVAIGLSRLGIDAVIAGRIGDDPIGRRIVRELRAEGVRAALVVDPDARTGLLIKERFAGARSRVTYWRADSAGSRLRSEDAEALLSSSVGLLHVTGITPALSAGACSAIDRLVDQAGERGVPVSFDINHRTQLWRDRDPLPIYRAIVRRASIVFGGLDEVELLLGATGLSAEAAARGLAALGPTEVVVKLGADGAVAYTAGAFARAQAVRVPVVDTVGAGDAFVAGYLAARLGGSDPADRLAVAVRTGAAACAHPGDWEGALHASEVATFGDSADPVIR